MMSAPNEGQGGGSSGEPCPPGDAPASGSKPTQLLFPKQGPYRNIPDPPGVAAGKDFTAAQKEAIIAANRARNGGVVKSDLSGRELSAPAKSQKGVSPSPDEWQIDHIVPQDQGGTNSYSNARVISKAENRAKSNLPAPVPQPGAPNFVGPVKP